MPGTEQYDSLDLAPMSEAELRALGDWIPAICWVCDLDGRTRWMNRHGLDFFGDDALAADNSARLVHPDDFAAIMADWADARTAGTPLERTVRTRGPDGRYRPLLSRAQPIHDATGAVTGWCGLQIDLSGDTVRRRHEDFLRGLSEATRVIRAPQAILHTACAMLGEHLGVGRVAYAETDPADRGLFDVDHEWTDGALEPVTGKLEMGAHYPGLVAALTQGEAFAVTEVATDPLLSPEGRARLIGLDIRSGIVAPLLERGELVAVLMVQHAARREYSTDEVRLVHEVSHRIWEALTRTRAETALQERERTQAMLLAWSDGIRNEGAPRVILAQTLAAIGAHLGVARVNYAEADATGEALLVVEDWVNGVDSLAGASIPLQALGQAVLAEHLLGVPFRTDDSHADPRFSPETMGLYDGVGARAFVSIPLVKAGRLVAVLSIQQERPRPWRDAEVQLLIDMADRTWAILERARAEAALARSRDALFQSEKLNALGSLLAGVSHELNNPLSIVVAQAVMMERQAQGSALAERAVKIRKAADRCARIVQTFLGMARQRQPERTAIDLDAVAAAALELTAYGLKTDGVLIERRFAGSLPFIAADADQLHQVIINLIVNAQQAMADAGCAERRLTLCTGPGDEPGTVRLDVIDSGPGVPPDARRRIFEPFFTTKPQGQGTGIGLSFSRGLAEAHGGHLTLIDSPAGAHFRLTLPIHAGSTQSDAAPEPRSTPPPPRQALVIDDEPEIAEVLADFLTLERFACTVATSGTAAQALLAEGAFDLIISDLRMPGMDGPELYAWLLARRPDLAARVAFATGDTLGSGAARFLAEARRPVLEKPFMPESVRHLLQQMDLP